MTDLDYAPDESPHSPGNLSDISNFIPTVAGSYGSAAGPTLEGYTAPGAAEVVGSAVIRNKAGTPTLFAGTSTKLYIADGFSGWTNYSGATYTAASSWEFLGFGDTFYAANAKDTIQKSSGATFTAVATAPIAQTIIQHENAIIALNLSTDSAGWARSDTGSDVFTVTASNDADSGTFLSGSGPVTAGTTFGNLAIAWKDDWMYGGRFIGDIDEKVRWDTLAAGVGCVGQKAYISTEIGIIFVSKRDILLFDGSAPKSIADKVRKAFFSALNTAARKFVFLSHDEIDRNIYFWIPLAGNGFPTVAFVYNYHSGKWGKVSTISSASTALDYVRCPVRNVDYADYITIGGATQPGLNACVVWGTTSGVGKLLNYSRSTTTVSRAGAPQMVTGYVGQPDRDSRLTSVYAIPDNQSSTLALASGHVDSFNPTLSTSNQVTGAVDTDGNLNVNTENRFHKATLTWTSGTTGSTEIRSLLPRFYALGGSR